MSQAIRLTVESCSSAVGVRDQPRGGVWVYTFINTSPQPLEVTDNSGAPVVYKVPSLSFVQAYCASTLGTADRLMFPSTNLPTLIIDNGLTLLAGDLDASGSTGEIKTPQGTNTLNGHTQIAGDRTFTTGTGAVSLNGATTVADAKPFTVGSSGSGGDIALYGNVLIGGSDSVASFKDLDVYGSVAFHDDPASVQTFSTASGQIDFNGHVDVAAGKHLHMGGGAGAGTFQTGAGAVTLNGDTSLPGAQAFATGTGAVTINGDTTIKDGVTFTAGSAGNGGNIALYGNVLIGGSGILESVSTTLYGDFAQNDDHDGSTFNTFSTATGAVSLNGHVAVAPGKDLLMSDAGPGSFRTGTGDVLLNGDVVITGARTFDTGTGAVRLNGAVAVSDSTSFSMGSPGTGGIAQFFGNVVIGGSPHGASRNLDVYGNVAFRNDGDGTKKTFQTASGDVTIFGDTTVAPHKFLHMHDSGTGTFQTGTGPVTFNGPTTVAHGNAFTIGTYTHEIACDHAWNDPGDTICKATR